MSQAKVAGLLLAAGSSTRAGVVNKLLYSKLQTTMVAHSGKTLKRANISSAVAITGESHKLIASTLHSIGFNVVTNPDALKGMGTSLRLGLAHLQSFDAVLICLADMPDLKTSTLNSVISCWIHSSHDKFIVSTYQGRRGNPVIIPKCFFSAFDNHKGDIGARPVIKQHPEHVISCEINDPAILTDYDTYEQLTAAGWEAPEAGHEK